MEAHGFVPANWPGHLVKLLHTFVAGSSTPQSTPPTHQHVNRLCCSCGAVSCQPGPDGQGPVCTLGAATAHQHHRGPPRCCRPHITSCCPCHRRTSPRHCICAAAVHQHSQNRTPSLLHTATVAATSAAFIRGPLSAQCTPCTCGVMQHGHNSHRNCDS